METYSSRKPVAANLSAAGGYQAGKHSRGGGAEAQSLLDDGGEIRQSGGALDGDFGIVLELATDLILQRLQGLGVKQEFVNGARQQRGGRFAARDDERVERGVDLRARHALLVVEPTHVRHEIGPLRVVAHLEPLADFGARVFEVVESLLLDLLRNEQRDDVAQDGEHFEGAEDDEAPEIGEEDGDPGVVLAVLQTAEGFAEFQIAGDVEGGEVEPIDDVDGTVVRLGVQPSHEQVEIILDEMLLFLERLLGESVGQQAPDPGVVRVVRGEDAVDVVDGRLIPQGVSGEVLLASVMAVDVLPGLGVGERQLVGRDTHNRTVLLVERPQSVHEAALHQHPHVWDAGQDP